MSFIGRAVNFDTFTWIHCGRDNVSMDVNSIVVGLQNKQN